jgi:hypothetical protein
MPADACRNTLVRAPHADGTSPAPPERGRNLECTSPAPPERGRNLECKSPALPERGHTSTMKEWNVTDLAFDIAATPVATSMVRRRMFLASRLRCESAGSEYG